MSYAQDLTVDKRILLRHYDGPCTGVGVLDRGSAVTCGVDGRLCVTHLDTTETFTELRPCDDRWLLGLTISRQSCWCAAAAKSSGAPEVARVDLYGAAKVWSCPIPDASFPATGCNMVVADGQLYVAHCQSDSEAAVELCGVQCISAVGRRTRFYKHESSDPCMAVAVSGWLFAGTRAGSVVQWDRGHEESIQSVRCCKDPVLSLQCGGGMVCAGALTSVYCLDMRSLTLVHELTTVPVVTGDEALIRSLCFVQNSQNELLAGLSNGQILQWIQPPADNSTNDEFGGDGEPASPEPYRCTD